MGSDEDMASRNQPVLSSNGQRTAEPSEAFKGERWTLQPATFSARVYVLPEGATADDPAIAVINDRRYASLIAAAPELYEALKEVVLAYSLAHLALGTDPKDSASLQQAHAALARAAPPPQGVNARGAEAFPDNHLNEGG